MATAKKAKKFKGQTCRLAELLVYWENASQCSRKNLQHLLLHASHLLSKKTQLNQNDSYHHSDTAVWIFASIHQSAHADWFITSPSHETAWKVDQALHRYTELIWKSYGGLSDYRYLIE